MIHRYVSDLSCKPNIYLSWSTSEIRVSLAPPNMLSIIFTERSKTVLLLLIFFVMCVSCMSCWCVCFLQNCGHLLRKGWHLGILVCDVSCVFDTFPYGCPGWCVVYDCIDFWSLPSYLLSKLAIKNLFMLLKLLTFICTWQKIQTDMIILDFSKAFDRVPHQRLLEKIYHNRIRGTTHQWRSSLLSSKTLQVLVEGQSSEKVPVVSWVPQGLVLGPVLFLMFNNDLPEDTNSSEILFADDCILYREIRSADDQQLLQQELVKLASGLWKQWGIEFHPKTYTVLRITRSRPPFSSRYKLKNTLLKKNTGLSN